MSQNAYSKSELLKMYICYYRQVVLRQLRVIWNEYLRNHSYSNEQKPQEWSNRIVEEAQGTRNISQAWL